MTDIIQSEALPLVKQQFDLTFNSAENTFEIDSFDQIMSDLEEMYNRSKQYEYHPDDRKDVKSLRAETNKMSKAIKDQIKTNEKALFKKPRQQEKELTKLITSIQKNITKGIDEEDARLKKEKKDQLQAMFKDALDYYDELDGLKYKNVAQAKWLNRSSSIKKSTQELNKRLKSLNTIVSSLDEYADINEVARVANLNDWDGLATVNQIKEEQQEKLRLQQEAYEAELKRREIEESNELVKEEQQEKQQYRTLIVKDDDLKRIKKLLQNRQIYFKVEE